jgi:hypothetical protein
MPRRNLVSGVAIAFAVSLIGCVDEEGAELLDEDVETTETESAATSVYTPFTGTSTIGSASLYSWRGRGSTYPEGIEDMRGYALPATIECSSSKSTRSHLDVTAGCLKAVAVGSYSRGRIESTTSGAFRVVALPYAGSEANPMKWTDQRNEFRFLYATTSGPGVDPGIKAFVRYRTENDLYVASWRMDGKVNIKRKQGGTYKTLAEVTMPRPSPNTWHTIQFHAIGTRLELYLDGTKVLAATDSTFAWGTAGIRTDAMTGAYLEDWRIR